MLYEYAVEPKAIGRSWQTFRYFIEKFGFDKGRLISQFPEDWFGEVYRAATGLSPIKKKSVEEALIRAKGTKVVSFGRLYDPELGWIDNALKEHRRAPFHAIVAAMKKDGEEQILGADDLDEQHPLIAVASERSIPRDVESLASALNGLLRFGSRIVFIDPFFTPFNAGYKRLFSQCLRIVRDYNKQASCEIHYRYHEDRFTNLELETSVESFRKMIPEGLTVTIFCWKEKEPGEDFHARYLLTERGGIRVDAGFEPVGNHQNTDVSLMNLELVQSRLACFSKDATIYELIEPVITVHSNGKVERV